MSLSLIRIFCISALCLCYTITFSQQKKRSKKSSPQDAYPAMIVDIKNHLKIFEDTISKAIYRISLCADVPNNKKPLKVAHRQQTGHVFLILQKIYSSGDTMSRVFGFYPKTGLSTVLFKKTKSRIKDNSHREYDVEINKELSAQQFDTILAKSILYASHKYHMNRYNCYDYAILIFNSAAVETVLPINHIRFPFIFGKGGSPCSVYRDLKKMKNLNLISINKSSIRFADMIAPVSSGRALANQSELSVNQ